MNQRLSTSLVLGAIFAVSVLVAIALAGSSDEVVLAQSIIPTDTPTPTNTPVPPTPTDTPVPPTPTNTPVPPKPNSTPVTDDDSYSTNEDTTLNVAAPGVLDGDTDADNDPLTAMLDRSTSNGMITLNTDGSFAYTPNADQCGPDSFTYHANDGEADSNVATVSIDVLCANDAPVVNRGDLALDAGTINENDTVVLNGTFTDPDAGDTYTVTIDWGDGGGDTVLNLSGGERSFSVSHQYLDDNPSGTPHDQNTITVTLADAAGANDSASTTIWVDNIAPVLRGISAPMDPVPVSGSSAPPSIISVSDVLSDTGVLDTYTAAWDWDDGNTTTGTVTGLDVSGNHSYAQPGVYTIVLTVTDDDTGQGESVFRYVVVYDPDGGSVIGGGWIDSPSEACPDFCGGASGKATFGFVSKYKKGADAPTGNTEFQFKAGDLNFHSDSYEWLVVAGAKAMYKGTGTVNGVGNYGFMLSAIDADLTPSTDVDLFRIKIWDKDNGDAVVYDNQMGAGDDAEPTTAIGGGSIVIHKGKGQ